MPRTRTRPTLRTAALAVLTAIASVPLLAGPAYAAAPSVLSMSPSSVAEGSNTTPVTLTGANFVSGATLDLGGGITVSGTSTANAAGTSLTGLSITVIDGAQTGPRIVTVTNPDASTGSCPAPPASQPCFTVLAGPSITSVNPNAANPGQSRAVVISGSGFQSSPVVTAGPGITVTNVTRPDANTINATFTVPTGTAPGPRDVTVTNADGSTATLFNGFSVGTAVAVFSISPNIRGRGAQNQVITITGTNFAPGASVTFSGTGITVDSTAFVSSGSLSVIVDIAPNATLGQRNVTITNPNGISGSCTSCFNVTTAPTVTAVNPSSVGRGRQSFDVTVTGAGFVAGAVASFGQGITVVSTTVTNSATLVARINVDANATVASRDVLVINPDGGTGTCANCFTVTTGRVMVLEIVDTKGTTSTADDVVTTRPVSGTTYNVRVTAKQSTATSNTDTTYTGVPVLTSTDTSFSAGSCSAAVNGVATCTGVRFGDLGTFTLLARGQSTADSDRNGSLAIVVQPTALVFTAAPTSGEVGQALTYTVTPQVGVNGAKPEGYAATRTLQVTGGGSSPANGSTLSCSSAVCTFTLSFTTAGAKTVAVSDNGTPSLSTPVVTVQIGAAVERGTYTPLVPARILDTRSADDADGFSTAIPGGSAIDVQVTGRGGVPTSGVSAVVVNATAVTPTTDGFVTLYPSGTSRPNASSLNFLPRQVVANLAVVKLGTNGRLSVFNLKGSTHVLLDVVGWYSTTPATTGGRTIAITPARLLDTRPDTDDVSTPVGPNAAITRQVVGVGGVPATGVTAVVVNLTAVRATASTFVTAYPSDATLPGASTLNVDPSFRIDGRVPEAIPNLAMVKVGADGKIALYNRSGFVDLILDVVGYVSGTSQATNGRFIALPPTRVLDTRTSGDGDAFSSPIFSGGAIDVPFAGRGGVPTTGVTAVVINVTAIAPTASTYLTVYPSGEARPTASNINAVPTQIVPNLVVVKLGSNGMAAIYNRSGSTHVAADVVGYLTS